MFLVIPFVEFLHVLGVDINVHHENPATFLGHMSVSSVKSSRHRFAPGPHAWSPGETRDTNWGAILADIPQISRLLSAIFRLIEAHRNEIRAQPASFAANRSGCSPRSHFHASTQKPPLTRPALAQLDGPPEHQVRRGKTTMNLMFLPTFRWKRVKAGCQRFYRRRWRGISLCVHDDLSVGGHAHDRTDIYWPRRPDPF